MIYKTRHVDRAKPLALRTKPFNEDIYSQFTVQPLAGDTGPFRRHTKVGDVPACTAVLQHHVLPCHTLRTKGPLTRRTATSKPYGTYEMSADPLCQGNRQEFQLFERHSPQRTFKTMPLEESCRRYGTRSKTVSLHTTQLYFCTENIMTSPQTRLTS